MGYESSVTAARRRAIDDQVHHTETHSPLQEFICHWTETIIFVWQLVFVIILFNVQCRAVVCYVGKACGHKGDAETGVTSRIFRERGFGQQEAPQLFSKPHFCLLLSVRSHLSEHGLTTCHKTVTLPGYPNRSRAHCHSVSHHYLSQELRNAKLHFVAVDQTTIAKCHLLTPPSFLILTDYLRRCHPASPSSSYLVIQTHSVSQSFCNIGDEPGSIQLSWCHQRYARSIIVRPMN
jgi:hypothetical protein